MLYRWKALDVYFSKIHIPYLYNDPASGMIGLKSINGWMNPWVLTPNPWVLFPHPWVLIPHPWVLTPHPWVFLSKPIGFGP
jgi:hypothetical protein